MPPDKLNFGGFMTENLDNKVRLMRMKQLSNYTSLSRAYLYNLIKDSDFPNSISLKGIRMWEKSDVDSWLDKHINKEVHHD
jgi:prophage regulatory protein